MFNVVNCNIYFIRKSMTDIVSFCLTDPSKVLGPLNITHNVGRSHSRSSRLLKSGVSALVGIVKIVRFED